MAKAAAFTCAPELDAADVARALMAMDRAVGCTFFFLVDFCFGCLEDELDVAGDVLNRQTPRRDDLSHRMDS